MDQPVQNPPLNQNKPPSQPVTPPAPPAPTLTPPGLQPPPPADFQGVFLAPPSPVEPSPPNQPPMPPKEEPIIEKKPFPKNKLFLALGIVLFLGVASGGAFLGFKGVLFKEGLFKKVVPVKPQIFVSEEVLKAEKEDLDPFFNLWRQAISNQVSFEEYKKLTLGDGGRFKNIPLIKVGEETLYGNDLNYLFLFYHFGQYTTEQKISNEILNEVVDIMMTDSLLLQEAAKQNLLTLATSFYNQADKNYTQRNEQMEIAKKALSNKLVQKISGEAISIWFNNVKVPLSVVEGKEIAQAKMEDLYQKLKTGEVSMKEAGEIIKNDKELGEKVDPAYQTNAYFFFQNMEKGVPVFVTENINQELLSLGEGQISTILTGKKLNLETGQEEELFFMILKVDKRTGTTQAETTEAMIEDLVQKAVKENLAL